LPAQNLPLSQLRILTEHTHGATGLRRETYLCWVSVFVTVFCICALGTSSVAVAQLNVIYGANGVQRLEFNGKTLEDISAYPQDVFHIYHLKMTDLHGKLLADGQHGWGEHCSSKRWDGGTKTWRYGFDWGEIDVQFSQAGSNLNVQVKELNLAGSGVILDGAAIYPLVLHLPRMPVSFEDARNTQLAFNTTGPSVTVADYGSGQVAAINADATKPLYTGFWPVGDGVSYYPIISSTPPDGLATFAPHYDRPVLPGQTDSFTVSLRFAPSGTASSTFAEDAYAAWRRAWPMQLKWTDRRAIGTIYLASSPEAKDIHRPDGFPNNPRRYFNDGNPKDFDVTTRPGLEAFQVKVLAQAAESVRNLRRLHAQGAITWDIEGEPYPQNTSYICAPDQIAKIAPEMESIVGNVGSRYSGMKLDDAYFKTMTDAGFRVGVCVRPQHFSEATDGTGQQAFESGDNVVAELIRKMKFAHERWGATLFYVDSSVDLNGAPLRAEILDELARALPDSLIIPEESSPKDYAYSAPFHSFIFHGDLGTDPVVHSYYPEAFSVILINDADASTLGAQTTQLTDAVRKRDVLMAHVDYWQENNAVVIAIYEAAKSRNPQAAVQHQ